MSRTLVTLLIAGTILATGPASAGQIYQWRDASGRLIFGDKPPQSAKAEEVVVKPNVYTSLSTQGLTSSLWSNDKVVMYGTAWCSVCKKAKAYFEAKNIPYTEYDVEKSNKGKRDYKRMKIGRAHV